MCGCKGVLPAAVVRRAVHPPADPDTSPLRADNAPPPVVNRGLSAAAPSAAYKKQQADDKIYAVHLLDLNVRWHIRDGVTEVISLEKR